MGLRLGRRVCAVVAGIDVTWTKRLLPAVEEEEERCTICVKKNGNCG